VKRPAKNPRASHAPQGAPSPKAPLPAGEGRGEGLPAAHLCTDDPPLITPDDSPVVTTLTTPSAIILRGVRTHNLKAIDLDLPLKRMIVVTGPSGAGKSSLALDTLYAEGNRRYVETFSPYARQFLVRLDKPDAELIAGIPPAIAVTSPRARHSPRSTVGTITEAHHALGILFARAGQVVCRQCGQLVAPASPEAVSRAVEQMPEGTRYEIGFPLEIRTGTDQKALLASLRARGFTRLRIGGEPVMLDEPAPPLPADASIEVIVDRLVRGSDRPDRRTDSIETAFETGLGRCRIIALAEEDSGTLTFVRGWRCSRCGTDHIEPQPALFRYNSPLGACPVCEGTGKTTELDLGRIVPDPSRSIRSGAIAPWSIPAYRRYLDDLVAKAGELDIPVDVPFHSLAPAQVEHVVQGLPARGFPGLRGFFREVEARTHRLRNRLYLSRFRRLEDCPACHGARLRPEALAVKIGGRNIAELSAMTIRDLTAFLEEPNLLQSNPAFRSILSQISHRLGYLADVGLDYLQLDRPASCLAGGELQRVILTRTLGSGLVSTLYILDEPTAGAHPHDIGRLIAVLHRLRDQGNSLVVVEHDHDVIKSADHIVDLGPGAGSSGGEVLYTGPVAGLSHVERSATADYLSGRKRVSVPERRRQRSSRKLTVKGARGNNLKSIDVTFPLGILLVVTGVSGSGKSTLVKNTLFPALRERQSGEPVFSAPHDELIVQGDVAQVVLLDQAPLPRSARSNPATHLKAFDEIRRTFAATHEAKLRNYDAGRFSFNVEGGRCNTCQGNGFLTIDMQFLPDVRVRCPECRGTRYRPEILEVTYRGKNIAEVLDLTAREALSFFRNRPKVQSRLRSMLDIGLDYLRLGQPLSTLSGGEAQRLKLAGFLAQSLAALKRPGAQPHTVFLLDEPAAGLHPLDVEKLIEALGSLVERGHSVIVIEHSPEVMVSADWIIDLGPGGGDEGGRLVAEGAPEDVAKSQTPTGEVLAKLLASQRRASSSKPSASSR
jgi:excinuclease ABC subunit A